MLEFWTMWSFSWWSLAQLNVVKIDYPLVTSVVYTSLIGGFLTHVYPRRLTIHFKKKKYEIPYKFAIWLDLIGHQLPLLVLYKQRNLIKNRCGRYVLIPFSIYTALNYSRGYTLHKIYGISSPTLYLTGYSIVLTLSNYFHFNKRLTVS